MSVKEEFEIRKPDKSHDALEHYLAGLNLDIYPRIGCLHGLDQGWQTFSVKC